MLDNVYSGIDMLDIVRQLAAKKLSCHFSI